MIHLRIAFRGFVFVDLTLLADEDATNAADGPDIELVEVTSAHEAAEPDEELAELVDSLRSAARGRIGFRIP